MRLRCIRTEHGVDDLISNLGIGFRRYDELMEIVNEMLCRHPEMFPILKGTRISLCKTNEFVGNSFLDVPSLAIYFHYDDDNVYIISVERNGLESYGAK